MFIFLFTVDNYKNYVYVYVESDWRVYVYTSSEDKSGTDAQVTLTVFGEKGDTGPQPLGVPENGLFESGATDQFDVRYYS